MTARGTVRLASRISAPIIDALSTPPNANAIVDQKITSFNPVAGIKSCGRMGVAVPNRAHRTAPHAIRIVVTVHVATAPALVSHLPTSRPTMFTTSAMARPISDAETKYVLLDDH